MTIRVTIQSRGFEEMLAKAKLLDSQFAVELPGIGIKARDDMRGSIERQKTREGSEGKLEQAIDIETTVFTNGIEVGIGNIQRLNAEAPYWAIQNYGGMVAEGARVVPGFFGEGDAPAGRFKGPRGGIQKFTHARNFRVGNQDGVAFMRVTTPITPMNYIEYASVKLITNMQLLVTKMTGLVNSGVKVFPKALQI